LPCFLEDGLFSVMILVQRKGYFMKWITLWILTLTAICSLLLTYFYLSDEWREYSFQLLIGYGFLIVLPYMLWKYNQVKFVEKREIVIQILKD